MVSTDQSPVCPIQWQQFLFYLRLRILSLASLSSHLLSPKEWRQIKITKFLICDLLHSTCLNDFLTCLLNPLMCLLPDNLHACTNAHNYTTRTQAHTITHVSRICRATRINVLKFYQTTLFTDSLTTLISYMHTQHYAW